MDRFQEYYIAMNQTGPKFTTSRQEKHSQMETPEPKSLGIPSSMEGQVLTERRQSKRPQQNHNALSNFSRHRAGSVQPKTQVANGPPPSIAGSKRVMVVAPLVKDQLSGAAQRAQDQLNTSVSALQQQIEEQKELIKAHIRDKAQASRHLTGPYSLPRAHRPTGKASSTTRGKLPSITDVTPTSLPELPALHKTPVGASTDLTSDKAAEKILSATYALSPYSRHKAAKSSRTNAYSSRPTRKMRVMDEGDNSDGTGQQRFSKETVLQLPARIMSRQEATTDQESYSAGSLEREVNLITRAAVGTTVSTSSAAQNQQNNFRNQQQSGSSVEHQHQSRVSAGEMTMEGRSKDKMVASQATTTKELTSDSRAAEVGGDINGGVYAQAGRTHAHGGAQFSYATVNQLKRLEQAAKVYRDQPVISMGARVSHSRSDKRNSRSQLKDGSSRHNSQITHYTAALVLTATAGAGSSQRPKSRSNGPQQPQQKPRALVVEQSPSRGQASILIEGTGGALASRNHVEVRHQQAGNAMFTQDGHSLNQIAANNSQQSYNTVSATLNQDRKTPGGGVMKGVLIPHKMNQAMAPERQPMITAPITKKQLIGKANGHGGQQSVSSSVDGAVDMTRGSRGQFKQPTNKSQAALSDPIKVYLDKQSNKVAQIHSKEASVELNQRLKEAKIEQGAYPGGKVTSKMQFKPIKITSRQIVRTQMSNSSSHQALQASGSTKNERDTDEKKGGVAMRVNKSPYKEAPYVLDQQPQRLPPSREKIRLPDLAGQRYSSNNTVVAGIGATQTLEPSHDQANNPLQGLSNNAGSSEKRQKDTSHRPSHIASQSILTKGILPIGQSNDQADDQAHLPQPTLTSQNSFYSRGRGRKVPSSTGSQPEAVPSVRQASQSHHATMSAYATSHPQNQSNHHHQTITSMSRRHLQEQQQYKQSRRRSMAGAHQSGSAFSQSSSSAQRHQRQNVQQISQYRQSHTKSFEAHQLIQPSFKPVLQEQHRQSKVMGQQSPGRQVDGPRSQVSGSFERANGQPMLPNSASYQDLNVQENQREERDRESMRQTKVKMSTGQSQYGTEMTPFVEPMSAAVQREEVQEAQRRAKNGVTSVLQKVSQQQNDDGCEDILDNRDSLSPPPIGHSSPKDGPPSWRNLAQINQNSSESAITQTLQPSTRLLQQKLVLKNRQQLASTELASNRGQQSQIARHERLLNADGETGEVVSRTKPGSRESGFNSRKQNSYSVIRLEGVNGPGIDQIVVEPPLNGRGRASLKWQKRAGGVGGQSGSGLYAAAAFTQGAKSVSLASKKGPSRMGRKERKSLEDTVETTRISGQGPFQATHLSRDKVRKANIRHTTIAPPTNDVASLSVAYRQPLPAMKANHDTTAKLLTNSTSSKRLRSVNNRSLSKGNFSSVFNGDRQDKGHKQMGIVSGTGVTQHQSKQQDSIRLLRQQTQKGAAGGSLKMNQDLIQSQVLSSDAEIKGKTLPKEATAEGKLEIGGNERYQNLMKAYQDDQQVPYRQKKVVKPKEGRDQKVIDRVRKNPMRIGQDNISSQNSDKPIVIKAGDVATYSPQGTSQNGKASTEGGATDSAVQSLGPYGQAASIGNSLVTGNEHPKASSHIPIKEQQQRSQSRGRKHQLQAKIRGNKNEAEPVAGLKAVNEEAMQADCKTTSVNEQSSGRVVRKQSIMSAYKGAEQSQGERPSRLRNHQTSTSKSPIKTGFTPKSVVLAPLDRNQKAKMFDLQRKKQQSAAEAEKSEQQALILTRQVTAEQGQTIAGCNTREAKTKNLLRMMDSNASLASAGTDMFQKLVTPSKRQQTSSIYSSAFKHQSAQQRILAKKSSQLQIAQLNESGAANSSLAEKVSSFAEKKPQPKLFQLEDFIRLKELGKGSFGEVWLVRHKTTQDLYALKMILKERIRGAKHIQHVQNEKKILDSISSAASHDSRSADTSFFVNFIESMQDETTLYLLLEYLPGGELLKQIRDQMSLAMEDSVFYLAEVLIALEQLHTRRVIFRDLKPENILLDRHGHIKLIDFGFSKQLSEQREKARTNCGTPAYAAPEVLIGAAYSFKADIWSFGILICEILGGFTPFGPKAIEIGVAHKDLSQTEGPGTNLVSMPSYQIIEMVNSGNIILPKNLNMVTRDLVRRILVADPNVRLDIKDIKQHKFFKGVDWHKVTDRETQPPYVPSLYEDANLVTGDAAASQQENLTKESHVGNPTYDQAYGGGPPEASLPQGIAKSASKPKASRILGDFHLQKLNQVFVDF